MNDHTALISAEIEREYLESVLTEAELKAYYATDKKETRIAAYGGGRKAINANKRDVVIMRNMLPFLAAGFVTSLFFVALIWGLS